MPFFILINLGARGEIFQVISHLGKRFIHILETGKNPVLGKKINDILRKRLRKKDGREPQASAAIIDSQSIKTTHRGGVRGYDGGKKILGRKRHILVDALGLLMVVVVHSAGIQDRDGGLLVLDKMKGVFSRLKVIWADGGYLGKFIIGAKQNFNRNVEVIKRCDDTKGFKVLPKRWIVERSFAWLINYRRHSKDYEYLTESSEAMIYISMIQLMLKRK